MKVDLERLLKSLKTQLSITSEGIVKNRKGEPASKQYINQLVQDEKLPLLKIDGVTFIISDPELAEQIKIFQEKQRIRAKKTAKKEEENKGK